MMKKMNLLTKTILMVLVGINAVVLSGCNLFDNKVEGFVGDDQVGGGPIGGGPIASKVGMAPTAAEVLFAEGGTTNAVIQFNKSLPSAQTINWTIENGAADFVAATGSVNVAAGANQFQIALSAVDEGLFEGEETFNLKIDGDDNVFASDIVVPLKIQELSPQPIVSFQTPAQTASETTGSVTITVQMSQASGFLTKVILTTSGSAGLGTDVNLTPSDAVIFLPGETSKTITAYPVNDVIAEPLEDMVITLDRIDQGTASIDASNKTHTLLIEDNDNPALFNITGARGGADVTADGYLTAGNTATVVWTDAPSELQYEVTLFKNDGVSIQCPTQTVGAGVTSYTFSGCALSEGVTYKISVTAILSGGTSSAGNDMFPFTVDTLPPGNFNIVGVMGGLDISPDSYLAGSLEPTIVWTDAVGENGYQVSVYNMSNALICGPVSVPANTTSVSLPTCTLTGGTNYKLKVLASDFSGQTKLATNDMLQFLVTTVPSGYLILGVTGGTGDTVQDQNMDDGTDVVAHWQMALGAVNYDVQINNMNDTLRCGPINVPGNLRQISFPGCHLNLHDQYKVLVTAYDSINTPFVAANSPYVFRNRVGLYISGTGGSYYRGATLTTCGGGAGDECNAANPYVISATYNESQIRIANNGVLAGTAWIAETPLPGNGVLDVTTDYLVIESGGQISMSGRGYAAGQGPGGGETIGNKGSGGSHGGVPGILSGAVQDIAYGDPVNPNTMGSGGGTATVTYQGGTGGGVIQLTVNTLLTFNTGSITANGADGGWDTNGACTATCAAAGGGAGGSIKLTVNEVSGTAGVISANGGTTVRAATAGAGGRVALYYETMSYTGGLAALGLRAYGASTTSPSSAGTVFYKDITDDPNGYIVADNNNIPHVQGIETPLPSTLVFDDIITRNLGTFIVPMTDTFNHISSTHNFRLVLAGVMNLPGSGRDITIGPTGYLEWRRIDQMDQFDNITIAAGGVLTHSANTNVESYHLDILCQSLTVNGSISANGKGYSADNGPGAGSGNAGPSYGGIGGKTSGTSGASYGSIRQPSDLGSGGNNSFGGGWIKIDANTLNLNSGGLITANGNNGSGLGGTGGTGGTIRISAANITGTGATLSVTGGDGAVGGGGGGRIAIDYDATSYAGGVAAIGYLVRGGDGAQGAAGTVYHIHNGVDTNGHLMVLNSPRTYNDVATTPMKETLPFDSITTDSTGTPQIPLGYSMELPGQNVGYRMVVEGDFTLPSGGDDLTIQNGGYFEWRRSIPLTLDNLTIDTGGTLTHTANTSSKQYYINVEANNVVVNGSILADSKGYSAGFGPGYNSVVTKGAHYAGYGGLTTSAEAASANPYGMEKMKIPDDLGSSSMSQGNSAGRRGGGYIRLNVINALTVNGVISANGQAGTAYYGDTVGAGSGGSIYITANDILGSAGTIRVNGGNGDYGFDGYRAGSGSGGRISIVVNSDSYTGGIESLMTSGTLSAFGGTANNALAGAAGTIYIKESGDTNGRLYVNNGGNPYVEFAETPVSETLAFDSITTANNGTLIVTSAQNYTLPSSSLASRLVVAGIIGIPASTLSIENGGYLDWRRNTNLNVNSLTIKNGGILTHSSNANVLQRYLNITSTTFDLQSGGLIDVDGKGYTTASGLGGGTGGGAYGGNSRTNLAYGSIKNPEDLGSGGQSGAGGGYVKIVNSGTMTLSGTIRSRGINGGFGGGSGGTIFLQTDTLNGTAASLNANGGNGTNSGAEAGAGGRIALLYNTDSYTGGVPAMNMTAYGGATNTSAAAGTIYYRDLNSEANGHLIVRNNGAAYGETNTTPVSDSGNFDSIIGDGSAAVEVQVGESFTLPSSTLNYRLIMAGDVSLPSGSTLTIASGGILELRRGTVVTSFPEIIVNSGGLITHTSNTSVKQYWVNLDVTNMTLNGDINVTAKGYAAMSGPGAGTALSGSGYAAGASHAGIGNAAATATGVTYGSVKLPNDLGSGGGTASSFYTGGSGGGLVVLKVANDFTLNGNIFAAGGVGLNNPAYFGGAGAGGSVRVETANLLGSGGTISVNGGEGAGGNGGGGRASLVVTIDDSSYGGGSLSGVNIAATGGLTSTRPAAAGTIYTKGPSDTNGHLRIDNSTLTYAAGRETEIGAAEAFDSFTVANSNTGIAIKTGVAFNMMTSTLGYPLRMAGTAQFTGNNLTIQSGGQLYFDRSATYTLNDLTLLSGSLLSHSPNSIAQTKIVDLNITNNFDLQSGALIDVTGKGFAVGQGPGRAQSSGGTKAGGGASHGALGGQAGATSSAGLNYGLPATPNTIGSGGASGTGACLGSSGGGYVKINAVNFNFDGDIHADGAAVVGGACQSGGGGSGGGVYLIAGTMTGTTGTVSANGGSAPTGATNGGGGGGGLIKVEASTNSFAGDFSTQLSALGGSAEADRVGSAASPIHP